MKTICDGCKDGNCNKCPFIPVVTGKRLESKSSQKAKSGKSKKAKIREENRIARLKAAAKEAGATFSTD